MYQHKAFTAHFPYSRELTYFWFFENDDPCEHFKKQSEVLLSVVGGIYFSYMITVPWFIRVDGLDYHSWSNDTILSLLKNWWDNPFKEQKFLFSLFWIGANLELGLFYSLLKVLHYWIYTVLVKRVIPNISSLSLFRISFQRIGKSSVSVFYIWHILKINFILCNITLRNVTTNTGLFNTFGGRVVP